MDKEAFEESYKLFLNNISKDMPNALEDFHFKEALKIAEEKYLESMQEVEELHVLAYTKACEAQKTLDEAVKTAWERWKELFNETTNS